MKQIVSESFKEVFTSNKRYCILMGGRGAGRSTVAAQYANAKLIAPEYFRCAIMRYILGDIRNSIYKEITDGLERNGIADIVSINQSSMTVSYGENSINSVGFKKSSSDQKSKLKSLANYNCVIIEEADEISEDDFMQLDDSLRTVKGDIKIILLLNSPAKNHWIIKRWFDLENTEYKDFYKPVLKEEYKENTTFIYNNYEVNKANIDSESLKRFNSFSRLKPEYYKNTILGLVAEVLVGKIYSNWNKLEKVPEQARLIGYGLDFGYSPDPTALIALYKYNDGYILEEKLYQTELTSSMLVPLLKGLSKAPIVADSASPAMIAEMQQNGINVIPCEKGQDSVEYGIKKVQDAHISYVGVNLDKEYSLYEWKMNKATGESTGSPNPRCKDHLLDAARYAITYFTKEENTKTLDIDKLQEIIRYNKYKNKTLTNYR